MHRIRGKTLRHRRVRTDRANNHPKSESVWTYNQRLFPALRIPKRIQQHGAQKVSFSELLATSDFITIHAPLTAETQCMFSDAEFRAMKPTAFLINTARGGIVDTAALTTALQNGTIAGAGLDVLETEPPDQNEALLTLDNVVVTPHAAFVSEDAILELEVTAATCVAQVLTGQLPESVVNPSVLEQPNLRAKSLK